MGADDQQERPGKQKSGFLSLFWVEVVFLLALFGLCGLGIELILTFLF
jgi:hypothetical protein